MPKPTGHPAVREKVPAAERNQLEIIRFPSRESQIEAIGLLLDRGMLNFSANRLDEWMVYTPVARKLRELGATFEWLTEFV